jgi:hypothetical protein
VAQNLYTIAWLLFATTLVKQQGTVEFPVIGPVTIRASLPMNQFPVVSFFDRNGKLLLSQKLGTDNALLFRANPLENTDGGENPTVRFKQVPGPVPDQLAILSIAMFHGGSDCAYEGTLIGEHNDHLKSFFTKPVGNNAEGGMYVGDLGDGKGYGFASWNFIWDMGTESHVDPHRYRVKLYRFDHNSGTMVLFFDRKTAKKYEDPQNALSEFGLKYEDILASLPDFTC